MAVAPTSFLTNDWSRLMNMVLPQYSRGRKSATLNVFRCGEVNCHGEKHR